MHDFFFNFIDWFLTNYPQYFAIWCDVQSSFTESIISHISILTHKKPFQICVPSDIPILNLLYAYSMNFSTKWWKDLSIECRRSETVPIYKFVLFQVPTAQQYCKILIFLSAVLFNFSFLYFFFFFFYLLSTFVSLHGTAFIWIWPAITLITLNVYWRVFTCFFLQQVQAAFSIPSLY